MDIAFATFARIIGMRTSICVDIAFHEPLLRWVVLQSFSPTEPSREQRVLTNSSGQPPPPDGYTWISAPASSQSLPEGMVAILSAPASNKNLPEGMVAIQAKDLKAGDNVVIGKPVTTPLETKPMDANTKRKTEDIIMGGMSPMAQRMFEEYQRILVSNPEATHEQAVQEMMFRAKGTEQVSAIWK